MDNNKAAVHFETLRRHLKSPTGDNMAAAYDALDALEYEWTMPEKRTGPNVHYCCGSCDYEWDEPTGATMCPICLELEVHCDE